MFYSKFKETFVLKSLKLVYTAVNTYCTKLVIIPTLSDVPVNSTIMTRAYVLTIKLSQIIARY